MSRSGRTSVRAPLAEMAAAAACAALLALMTPALLSGGFHVRSRLLLALTSLLVLAAGGWYLVASSEDILGPAGLFLVVLVIWFPLRGFVVALAPESLRFNVASPGRAEWSALTEALLYVAAWAGVALVSYHSRIGRWFQSMVGRALPRRPGTWGRTVLNKSLLLYGLGLVGKAYRLLSGTFIGTVAATPEATGITYQTGYDPVASVLGTILPLIGQIGFIFAVVAAVRIRRDWLVLTLLAVELSYGLVTATRGALLAAAVVVIMAYYLWGQLSERQVVVLGGLGLVAAFLVVAPYRALIASLGLTEVGAVDLNLTTLLNRAWSSGLATVFAEPGDFLLDAVLGRFNGLDRFAGAVHAIETGAARFAHGTSFWHGFTSSIPSILTGQQTTFNVGYWFPVRYLEVSGQTETVIPMPRAVEFYVNFGLLGLLAGAAGMGVALRGAKAIYYRRSGAVASLYIFLAVNLLLLGEKPASSLISLYKPLFVLIVAMYFVTWSTGKRGRGLDEVA